MKFSVFNLIFTVFLLWLTIQLKSSHEDYLAYISILTVGILHGANDISLIEFLTQKTPKRKVKFLLIYVGLIVVTSIAFFNFPLIALLVFIVFSCYHFGEQHFYNQIKGNGPEVTSLYISYGILIFGLLFYLNYSDTVSIIFELTGLEVPEVVFQYFMLCGMGATVLLVIINRTNHKQAINYLQELFLIIVFALIFELASLLWAFAIYFIVWHSIPSLKDQINALYGNLDKRNILKYVKSSLLNWMISIIGLAVVYYFSALFDIRFITLFFAFLAAITIPHVIVMYFLNKNQD